MTTKAKQQLKIEPETWETVRKWFHYPALPKPEVKSDLEGGAHFDFSSGDIKVGEAFVQEIVQETGLSKRECLEGILTHEVGHYMVFPRNLSTIILSGKMLNDFFCDNGKSKKENEQKQNYIFQTYADIADDTASVLDANKRDPVINLRSAGQQTMPDELNKNIREVMFAYLNRQAGINYTLDPPELDSYLERMLQIEFLDPSTNRSPKDPNKLRLGLFQWGDIVNDMVGKYEGTVKLGDGPYSDLNIDEILKNMSPDEIKKAMREMSGEVARGEYKQIRKWLEDRGIEVTEGIKSGEFTIGTSKGELKVDSEVVRYYKELSKKYPLVAHKKPIPIEKTKKSFEETEKWRVGKESLLAMPNLSGGLFLPGITRQIRVKEKQIKTTDYDLPHLLVAIDSSGSMPDPENRKSYAVLAGVCAARSYHVHDSAVGVVNFSGDSFYLPYSRNLDDIISAICSYQGGGTSVDVDILKKMLSPEEFRLYEDNPEAHIRQMPNEAIKKDVELSYETFKKALESGSIDLLMFTDGGISNLGEVLEFFEENKTLNRGTIVLTDHYEQFIPPGEHPNINIYRIDKEEDIPSIVLRDVRRNMNLHSTNYETRK